MTNERKVAPRRRARIAKRWAWAAPLLAATACTPAGLLTSFDQLTSGKDSRRVAAAIPYGSDDRQKLDIWAPRNAASDKLPVVVFFYGGGWNEGARGDYGFAGAAYASQGFIAVVPDYRLVPQVRFPAFVQDGALSIRWVLDNIERYGGDPERITIAGHSAGAHIGAMLALDARYLAAAGVRPGTVKAAALLAGPYDFLPLNESRGRNAFGAWPRPEETQPISFASASAPPIFLAHGSNDRVVLARNSRRLAERLQQAGATVELRIYQGASHVDLASSLAGPFRGKTPVLAESSAFLREQSLVARPAAASQMRSR